MPDAELLVITISEGLLKKGDHEIKLDAFSSDVDGAQDVTIVDGANTDIDELEIGKLGKNDGEDDVLRIDLSSFDDDFTITVKSEEANDLLVIEDVEAVVENGDGTYTVTYVGADGQTHTANVDPDSAQVQFVDATPPGPDQVKENQVFVANFDLIVTCPTGGVEEFCGFKATDGKPVAIAFSYDYGTGIEQDLAGSKHEITTEATISDGPEWNDVFIVVRDKNGNIAFEGEVSRGETFTAFGTKVDGSFEADSYFEIYDFEGGPLLQDILIHTSCSDPTSTQDRFGSLTIESATLQSGRVLAGTEALSEPDITYAIEGEDAELFNIDPDTGVVAFKDAPDFEDPQDVDGDNLYNFTVVAHAKADPGCVAREQVTIEVTDEEEFCILENSNSTFSTSIVVDCPEFGTTPQDLCMFKVAGDKPATLLMVYDFGTGIEQVVDGDKHEILTAAQQPDGAAWDNVYIVVKDKNGLVQFEGEVARGEAFEISGTKDDGTFESETYFEIYDFQGGQLLQEINVHTSCSDPTNTTDRFGSITLAGATLESGTVISGYTNTHYSGDELIYTLTGEDAALFQVDENGDVTFINPPDFENPLDADGDNEYVVIVRGAIPGADKFAEELIVICVEDDDDVTTIAGRVFRDTSEDGLEAEFETISTPQPDEVRNIEVANASFDDADLSDGSYNSSITGWSTNYAGYSGAWDAEAGDFASTHGDNVAWLEGAGTTISQTLDETYSDGSTYEFWVDIGDSSYDDDEDFTVRLYAGASVIAMASGNTGTGNDFDTIGLSTTGFSNASLDGQALKIEITNDSGSWIYVDNVRGVVTTPQPDLITTIETIEPPFVGATIMLLDANGDPVLDDGEPVTTTSDADGNYAFEGIAAGDYRVRVVEPLDHDFTTQDVGSDDAIDSDVDETTGVSDVISIADGQQISDLDAGLVFNPSAPPVAADDVLNTNENSGVSSVNIVTGVDGNDAPASDLGVDTDPEGPNEELRVTKVFVDGQEFAVPADGDASFTLTLSGDQTVDVTVDDSGQVTVATPEGFDLTNDQDAVFSFDYEITDAEGLTDIATVTINVDDLNEAPIAVDNLYSVGETENGSIGNVLLDEETPGAGPGSIDNDPNPADVLTVVGLSADEAVDPSTVSVGSEFVVASDQLGLEAKISVAADGSITFDGMGNFDGLNDGKTDTISLSYTVSDGNGGEDVANVSITVNGEGSEPSGPSYNIVFLVDASASAFLAGASPIAGVGDLNQDTVFDTAFDASLHIVQSLLGDFADANIGSGVDVGVYSFESDLSPTEPVDFVTELDADLLDLTLAPGTDLSGIYDDANGFGSADGRENGVAVFDSAIAAANGFFAANGGTDDNAENLVFIISDSFGQPGTELPAEQAILSGYDANVEGLSFGGFGAVFGPLRLLDSDGFITDVSGGADGVVGEVLNDILI